MCLIINGQTEEMQQEDLKCTNDIMKNKWSPLEQGQFSQAKRQEKSNNFAEKDRSPFPKSPSSTLTPIMESNGPILVSLKTNSL